MGRDQSRGCNSVTARVIGLFTETLLHLGTGQSAGDVDLPVQRERHTGYPVIPASSLKGSLRGAARNLWGASDGRIAVLFGPETQSADLHAGALSVGEGHIAAFPVRSIPGPFRWVTCDMVLGRLTRDLEAAGALLAPGGAAQAAGADGAPGVAGAAAAPAPVARTMVLEDYEISGQELPRAMTGGRRAWGQLAPLLPPEGPYAAVADALGERLLLVPDKGFEYLCRAATEVAARVALNEQKTSENLWFEEALPRDCLFYAIIRVGPSHAPPGARDAGAADPAGAFDDLLEGVPYLQMGGNETVGQGWCRIVAAKQVAVAAASADGAPAGSPTGEGVAAR